MVTGFSSFSFNLQMTALKANNCSRGTHKSEKPPSRKQGLCFWKTPLPGVKGNLQLEQIQHSSNFLNNSAGGAGSCQTEEAWLAIESLNAAPFPPQTHGIYINLQLFLAGGNFFFLICLSKSLTFVALVHRRSRGDGSAPCATLMLAEGQGC